MKKRIFLLFGTIAALITLQGNAQHTDFASHISISTGFTFAGPVGPMSKYMIAQGYDAQNVSVFFFGPADYPIKTSSGGSIALNYTWNIKKNKQLNLQVGFSDLGSVSGYSSGQGSLNFNFQAIHGDFYYSILQKPWVLKIGASLQLNQFTKDEFSLNENKKWNSKLSIGLFTGIGLHLWNGRRTFGLLNCDYRYMLPNKVGPFSSNSSENENDLPETNISFKHATASFTFGIHL